jgi:hypothetical protein
MKAEVLVECSICGADTEWDDIWGKKPLCVACWDAQAQEDYEQDVKRCMEREGNKPLPEEKLPCVKSLSSCASCRDVFTKCCRLKMA